MNNVSASQPRDRGFEPHTCHDHDDHDSSYDTSTGWFQEADSRVINLSCDKLFHNRAKINMFKLSIFTTYLYLFIPFFCIVITLNTLIELSGSKLS